MTLPKLACGVSNSKFCLKCSLVLVLIDFNMVIALDWHVRYNM